MLILFVASCKNSYQAALKSDNLDYKFTKAKEYYNKKDYFRAMPLFEELMNVYKGTKDAEKIYFFYAYCQYGIQEFYVAAYHFKNFSTTYPKSEYAEKSQFMYAYCHYLMSPKASLDQSNTTKAMDAFQLFTNLYPNSLKVDTCNTYIDELRLKIQTKDFNNANLYYKLGQYSAAKVAFENLISEYPDLPNKEEALFLSLKSSYAFADNSIKRKQRERLEVAITSYKTFLKKYPNSNYKIDAEKIFTDCNEKLNQLNNN